MKIRTDFVTNSSSSSYIIMVRIRNKQGEEHVSKTTTYRRKVEALRKRYPSPGYEDVASIKALLALLGDMGVSSQALSRIEAFACGMSELEQIDISLVWDSHGESSGCTVVNDKQLRELAEALVNADSAEKQEATNAFISYLSTRQVEAEGAWNDETWPVGFLGNNPVDARYGWSAYAEDVEKLAALIVGEKYSNDDLGVEIFRIDPVNKKTSYISELMVDGSRSILKASKTKTAKSANKTSDVQIIPLQHVEERETPKIDLEGYTFSYKEIDQVPASYYQVLLKDEGVIAPISNCMETLGNFHITVALEQSFAELVREYTSSETEWYDPYEAVKCWNDHYVTNHAAGTQYTPMDHTLVSRMGREQFRHRLAVFLRQMSLCTNKAVLKKIVEDYPKKKNQLFYKGRVLRIAWLFAVQLREEALSDKDILTRYFSYQLYAKAESDTELSVTARLINPVDANLFLNANDLAVTTNLFSMLD